MKIFCDDGSTNVKLAWFEGKTLKSAVSVNSFRCMGPPHIAIFTLT